MARTFKYRTSKTRPHQFNVRLDDQTKEIANELDNMIEVNDLAFQILKEELPKELKRLKAKAV